MSETTIMLRFRDLVTPLGGTIAEHQNISQRHGLVWWGWWKRQTETSATTLFTMLDKRIEERGTPLPAFLFDTGTERLFLTHLHAIAVAPERSTIATPEPSRSPVYYQQGSYPAWFLFDTFEERVFSDIMISHDSFPTNPELDADVNLKAKRIKDTKALRRMDVTLYAVKVDESTL